MLLKIPLSKSILPFFFLILCYETFGQQKIDEIISLNGLSLGSHLDELKNNLYLITGKETIYQNNPFLAKTMASNIEKGIKEGIYEGNTYHIINGSKTSDMRLYFFNNELFKIRWNFHKKEIQDLKNFFRDLKTYFEKNYGEYSDSIFEDTFIWQGKANRLQLFMDNDVIQIEFRNESIENKIKSL
ncbi:MAG: hypothetical protein ACXIUQ_16275 [Cecembia sp.]